MPPLNGDFTVVLEHPQGLYLLPLRQLVSLVPDYPGRWRAVALDGTLAYAPEASEPLQQTLVLCGSGLVRPELLLNGLDPAGFPWPQPPTSDGPQLGSDPPELHRVLYLEGADGQAVWHTDQGPLPAGNSAEQAAKQHPHLVRAGRGRYLNRHRLRWVLNERKRFRLILDIGLEFTISHGASPTLRQDLGLPSLYHILDESVIPLFDYQVRDWPLELYRADRAFLTHNFPDQRALIANLIWQTYRWRLNGVCLPYGLDHRGFWYRPIVTTLARAGFDSSSRLDFEPLEDLREPETQLRGGSYSIYLELLNQMIGRDRLFTFRQLGFRDPRPDLRSIGSQRPRVLLIAEKSDLEESVASIRDQYGLSTIILGGLPSLLSSEFMASDLHKNGSGSISLIAYVDFDPGGWIAAEAFADQLRRYGLVVEPPQFVIRPHLFTPEEIELFAMPIPTPTPQIEGKLRAWMEKSGGVNGQPLRLLASSLLPWSRALEEVGRLLPKN